MTSLHRVLGSVAVVLLGTAIPSLSDQAEIAGVVVFVCEHGSAKSVIAATHFNALAQARGLEVRALARGTSPDAHLPDGVIAGLARDGQEPVTRSPTRLGRQEVSSALRVVAFHDLGTDLDPASKAIRWQVPAVSADYEIARAAIVARVEQLLDELSSDRPKD